MAGAIGWSRADLLDATFVELYQAYLGAMHAQGHDVLKKSKPVAMSRSRFEAMKQAHLQRKQQKPATKT